MKQQLLPQAKKYFWGDDLSELSWDTHKKYIVETLLEKADFESVAWLMARQNKDELLSQLPSLKLSEKSKNFWELYLS